MFTFLIDYLNYYSVKSTSYNSNPPQHPLNLMAVREPITEGGHIPLASIFHCSYMTWNLYKYQWKKKKNVTIHFFHLKNRNRFHISCSHKVPKVLVVLSSQSCCDQAYWSACKSAIYLSPQSFPSLWPCKLHSLICLNK